MTDGLYVLAMAISITAAYVIGVWHGREMAKPKQIGDGERRGNWLYFARKMGAHKDIGEPRRSVSPWHDSVIGYRGRLAREKNRTTP
jgi:membrane carboxypeptidase/penicillin-binding protein PbpC